MVIIQPMEKKGWQKASFIYLFIQNGLQSNTTRAVGAGDAEDARQNQNLASPKHSISYHYYPSLC